MLNMRKNMELNNIPKLIGIAGRLNSGKDAAGNMVRYLTDFSSNNAGLEVNDYMTKLENNNIGCNSDYTIKKYADHLKQICADLLGIRKEAFESREFKDSFLPEKWSKFIYRSLDNNYAKMFPSKEECITFASERQIIAGKMPINWEFEEKKMTPRLLLQLMGTDGGRMSVHDNIWVNASFASWDSKLNQRWIFTDVRFPNEVAGIKERGGIVINILRDHIGHCLTGTEVYVRLDQLYDEHQLVEPGFFLGNVVSFSTMTHPQRIQEGIDMFLTKKAPEDNFKYIEPHQSEISLDSYSFEHVIHNGRSFEALEEKMTYILNKVK